MTYFAKPTDLAPDTTARSVALDNLSTLIASAFDKPSLADINNLSTLIDSAFDKLPSELDLKMGTVNYAVNTGPNGAAYSVVMASAITSYVDGLEVKMRPVTDNTGACTLNVNGLGNIAIKRADGTDPQAGDILGNTPITLTYQSSGNVFRMPPVVYSQIIQVAESSAQAQASAVAATTAMESAQASAVEAENQVTRLRVTDYAALRALTDDVTAVYVTGYSTAAAPSGIAGMFIRDDNDTTSVDNDGTIIVSTNGKRWKRSYNGCLRAEWFGAEAGGADCTPALAKAVACLAATSGGGVIKLGMGKFRLYGGAASPDGFKNGVLFPSVGTDLTTGHGIFIEGEGVSTVLEAGSDNMIIVRSSRLFSGLRNLLLSANGHANVWGGLIGPEDMTDTTKFGSVSFQRWDVYIEGTKEGVVVQPGPTVAGADSGCFYHELRLITNNCTRAVWAKTDTTGAGNRVTRSSLYVVALRGNTGIQIDYGSEIDIYANCEMINSGTSPNAVPVAILVSANNTENIRVRGYAEACTRDLVALKPIAVIRSGWFATNVPDSSDNFSTQINVGKAIIGRRSSQLAQLSFDNPSFVSLRADPDQNNSKTLGLYLNDLVRERWDADGSKTYYGTQGNLRFGSLGRTVEFGYNGQNLIQAIAGANATLYFKAAMHGWTDVAGTEIATMSGTEFIPRQSGVTDFGISGFYWRGIAALNITLKLPSSATPANNGEMTFELTSNTSLKVKVKGSDGVVRSATLTLA